jgi:hypothetical protein
MVILAKVNIRSSLIQAERFISVDLKSNAEKRCPIDKMFVTKVLLEGNELTKA